MDRESSNIQFEIGHRTLALVNVPFLVADADLATEDLLIFYLLWGMYLSMQRRFPKETVMLSTKPICKTIDWMIDGPH